MENPILVFYNPEKANNQVSLPTGWTESCKQINPVEVEENFLIMILPDDSMNIPDLKHTNKDLKTPILIISHGGTDMNGLSWNPEEHEKVKQWGCPAIPLKIFTHQPGNVTCSNITNLLSGKLSPAEFIKIYTLNFDLSLLSDLALICQIKLLDEKANVDVDSILCKLPVDMNAFKISFNSLYDEDTCSGDWKERLKLITKYAVQVKTKEVNIVD